MEGYLWCPSHLRSVDANSFQPQSGRPFIDGIDFAKCSMHSICHLARIRDLIICHTLSIHFVGAITKSHDRESGVSCPRPTRSGCHGRTASSTLHSRLRTMTKNLRSSLDKPLILPTLVEHETLIIAESIHNVLYRLHGPWGLRRRSRGRYLPHQFIPSKLLCCNLEHLRPKTNSV